MTDSSFIDQAMTRGHLLAEDAASLIRCPSCHQPGLALEQVAEEFHCPACHATFAANLEKQWAQLVDGGDNNQLKDNIQAWWGDLYKQLYSENDARLTHEKYDRQLVDLEDFFRISEHLAVNEMPLTELAGKRILEIGSGAGAHSALFNKYGADVVSVDLTPERVVSTALKHSLVKGGRGRAYQADAENLPFCDEQFDIVYSNGVLHHSENTETCLSEVYRVLKPGGLVVLMLYSRHSANVWFNIFPRGVLTGSIFRYPQAEWMGLVTEGKPKFGNVKNPITRVYSASQLRLLLGAFEIESMRKMGWEWDQVSIPRLTQFRRILMQALGFKLHPGGIPVAGVPRMPPCGFERWLSRHIGFCWDIRARKPGTQTND